MKRYIPGALIIGILVFGVYSLIGYLQAGSRPVALGAPDDVHRHTSSGDSIKLLFHIGMNPRQRVFLCPGV